MRRFPFITAGLAWLILRERESGSTLGATAAAFAGMTIMAAPGGGRRPLPRRPAGASAMATLMSLVIVLIRRKKGVNMVPAVCGSALPVLADRLAVRLADAGRCADLGLLALFGVSQFGLGLLLLAFGTPLVSATRGALIGVLQTPLGTLWVWLAFAEPPSTADAGRRRDRARGGGRRHAGASRPSDYECRPPPGSRRGRARRHRPPAPTRLLRDHGAVRLALGIEAVAAPAVAPAARSWCCGRPAG